jgi:GntR family transcriptional regulator
MQVRQLTSFSQDLQEEGWRPGSVILKIICEPADAEVSAHLRVDPGTPIHRVERLRTVGDEPIAHEIAHLPEPLPDLAVQLERKGSLYRTLREVFGIELEAVEDIVETALADPIEASLLRVDTGLPMLLVHRTGWDADGRIVEWTRSVFRGDRFRFVARRRLADDLPVVADSRGSMPHSPTQGSPGGGDSAAPAERDGDPRWLLRGAAPRRRGERGVVR